MTSRMCMKMYFPGFRRKALTFSYDDGVLQDRRLIDIFKSHRMKATFNLNSGLLGRHYMHRGVDHSHFEPNEIKEVYGGYEVAGHSLTHPDLTALTDSELICELGEDKTALERLCGRDVVGFAYPGGKYNDRVTNMLGRLGFKYARVVEESENFELPECLLRWKGTCRHTNPRLFELAERFLEEQREEPMLFCLWGHSYEFDMHGDWERMEKFCEMTADREDIWYAENGETADYISAYRGLVFEENRIYNPSDTDIYLNYSGRKILLRGREYMCLN